MLNGAGALSAFDSRTPGSTGAGQIGGLLQSSTYIAGLSGGGWLVGTIYSNNFTSVQNIIDRNNNGDVWQLGTDILTGPKTGGVQILSTADYYKNLVDTVLSKQNALDGQFNVSLTDYWARALSFQFVNATDGGPAFTFSSIQDDNDFKNGNAPLPVLVALERAPGDTVLSLNATNIEFNPWETGSFDPTLFGFVPTKYLGSNFSNGELPDGQSCVAGFDNAGFVMGTSSSLFNQILLNLDGIASLPDFLKSSVRGILSSLSARDNDIADYRPNPFRGFNNRTNPSANSERLTLVDGGEDLQNIPFNPLIQPTRHVDVIFAVDSSADTVKDSAENWPNGTAIVATFERTTNETMQNGTAFPYVPDQNTFVNLGLNNHPTFFGCNSSNLTSDSMGPLVVYIPNSPYVFNSNTSTFGKLSYTNAERNAMILNGHNVATMANGTRQGYSDWPTCVGCAIISRSLERNGQTVPDVCNQCFTKYCWNGTRASNTPAPYFPPMLLQAVNVQNGVGKFVPSLAGFVLTAVASVYLMI